MQASTLLVPVDLIAFLQTWVWCLHKKISQVHVLCNTEFDYVLLLKMNHSEEPCIKLQFKIILQFDEHKIFLNCFIMDTAISFR